VAKSRGLISPCPLLGFEISLLLSPFYPAQIKWWQTSLKPHQNCQQSCQPTITLSKGMNEYQLCMDNGQSFNNLIFIKLHRRVAYDQQKDYIKVKGGFT
jgi:hypothetical protein